MVVTGDGTSAAIDLAPGDPGTDAPGTRIRGTDDGLFGSHLDFMTKERGAAGNALTNRMRITSEGRVGIGTDAPTEAALVVNGSSSQDLGPYAFKISNNVGDGINGSAKLGGAKPRSIYASTIIGATGFHTFSDRRIKNVIGRSDRGDDLATLLAIEVTDYTLIDEVAHGSRPHKKVVAQQVESILPHAVTRSVDTVPDIFQMAKLTDGWIELSAAGLEIGDRVRLIGGEQSGVHEVLELREGAFLTTFESVDDEVFVYGREVSDFRSVDYEAIGMLNVSATQELHRIIREKDQKISDMEARLAIIEEREAARDAQVAAILLRLGKPVAKASSVELAAAE
ncbi:hypothetical protein BH23VER1_BH23VER1_02140 [soil metagenome]